MDFVERRIGKARRDGFFDNLEFRGRPLKDLDDERPAGWWADAWLARDTARHRLQALLDDLPRRKSAAFRSRNTRTILLTLEEINGELNELNEQLETKDQVDLLDVRAEFDGWWQGERRRRWGRYLDD